MIRYKKRSGTTVVEIQVTGSYTIREIAAVFLSCANSCCDMKGVVGFVVDCHGLDNHYELFEKKEILHGVIEILRHHRARIALVYNDEQVSHISYDTLYLVNTTDQFKVNIVRNVQKAYAWLDSEIETFMRAKVVEANRDILVQEVLEEKLQNETPVEVVPHDVFADTTVQVVQAEEPVQDEEVTTVSDLECENCDYYFI